MPKLPHKCRLLQGRYRLVLVVGLLATLVGGWYTTRLSLESDLVELLPGSFESVRAMERMKETVGGISVLEVVLESDDFTALKELAGDVAPRLSESEYVSNVRYRNPVDFYREHALLYLDTAQLDSLRRSVRASIDRARQEANPYVVDDLFGDEADADGASSAEGGSLAEWEERYRAREPKPYFTDPDSTVLVIQAFPSQGSADLSFSQAMLRDVQEIVRGANPERYAPDVRVYYGGSVMNRIDEFEAVRSDIFGTAAYGVGGVLLLLLLYFRSFLPPVLISLSLVASLSWTFGLTSVVIGQLNTITGFLFVILFGLGIDYGIHAFVRYRDSRQGGLDRDEALHRMVCRTGSALRTTTLTTSAAFFSLTLMDFRGFSELGFITGVGLVFAYLAMVILLPALVVGAEEIGVLGFEEVESKSDDVERRPFRGAGWIIAGAGVLTLIAGWAARDVGFQYDFTDLRIETEQREIVGRKTQGVFQESESPAVVLADSREGALEVAETVREQMRRDSTPTVSQVRTVYSLVPDHQERKLELIRDVRRLVREEAGDLARGETARRVERLEGYLQVDDRLELGELPDQEVGRFRTKAGEIGNFVLIFPGVPLRDGRNAMAFRDDIGTIRTDSARTYHAASPNIIVAELLTMVIREGKLAVGLSVGVVFLLLWLAFGSPRGALLVLSPLLVGVVWMGGLMELSAMRLNLFNMVVIPSVIGIGVDSGVHIYHRYREEGRGSLYLVLRRTGLAVTLATATTMVSYSGLVLAAHPGLVSIGKLALIGLGTTLLSALTVQPALIERFAPAPEAAR